MFCRKNFISIFLIVSFSILLFSNNAFSSYECIAKIEKIGVRPDITGTTTVSDDDYTIWLLCDAAWSGPFLYFLSAELGQAGYATALTAMSLDQNVQVFIEDWTWGSLITGISIVPVSQ